MIKGFCVVNLQFCTEISELFSFYFLLQTTRQLKRRLNILQGFFTIGTWVLYLIKNNRTKTRLSLQFVCKVYYIYFSIISFSFKLTCLLDLITILQKKLHFWHFTSQKECIYSTVVSNIHIFGTIVLWILKYNNK